VETPFGLRRITYTNGFYRADELRSRESGGVGLGLRSSPP
jgi:signal transduction histidine kinase